MASGTLARVVIRVRGKPKTLFSIFSMKDGNLGIATNSAPYHFDVATPEQVKSGVAVALFESSISIHTSPNSKQGVNVITHKRRLAGRGDKLYNFTKAIKTPDQFTVVLSRLVPDLSHPFFNSSKDPDKAPLWSLASYDPRREMLYYSILVGDASASFDLSELHGHGSVRVFGGFKVVILWNIIKMPSLPDGIESPYPTFDASAEPDPYARELLESDMLGLTSEAAVARHTGSLLFMLEMQMHSVELRAPHLNMDALRPLLPPMPDRVRRMARAMARLGLGLPVIEDVETGEPIEPHY